MAKYVDQDGNPVKKVKKPFFKRIWVWVVGIIIILGIFSSMIDDEEEVDGETVNSEEKSDETSDADDDAEDDDGDKEKVFSMDEKVNVENISYEVNDVYEETEIDNDNEFMDGVETDGKFVIVDLEIFNNDDESRYLDTEMLRVLDDEGTEYSPTSDADVYINDGDNGFLLEEVNPNMSKEGKVAFEVPEDAEDYTLQVSSGFGWSGGDYAEIDISK